MGAGTFVSGEAPCSPGATRPSAGALRPRAVWDRVRASDAFAERADYEFRTGLPDATRFPLETWRRLMGENQLPNAIAGVRYQDGAEVFPVPAHNVA